MEKSVSIIIVHWNTPELLKKQLKALTSSSLCVIVVDNNSDSDISWVKKNFPMVTLITNTRNWGFAHAVNQGFLKTDSKWILILNPDVLITPDDICKLAVAAEEKELDAGSPTPTSKNYFRPLPSLLSLLSEFTPLKYFIGDKFFSTQTLTGGALLIKRLVLESLGGLDERFFLWFEDADLTKQLIDNNYKIGWIDIPIEHVGGESLKLLDEESQRDIFFNSMEVYAKKHFNLFSQFFISLLKKKYSRRHLLPSINRGVTIVVPNMDLSLLVNFFKKNHACLDPFNEIIVVSSALNSQLIWEWRQKYPKVRFISISKNKGFAPTVNIGFRAATSEWLGTVNDDVLLSENWLRICLDCTKNPEPENHSNSVTGYTGSVGSINPVIYNNDKTVESAGIKILPAGKAIPIKIVKDENCYNVDATNAACVIYFAIALNETGLFDEKFGSYLEDVDLSLRLSRHSFINMLATKAKTIHIGQSSSKKLGAKKQFYDLRNWIFIIIKNWGIVKIMRYLPSIILERFRNLSGLIKAVSRQIFTILL